MIILSMILFAMAWYAILAASPLEIVPIGLRFADANEGTILLENDSVAEYRRTDGIPGAFRIAQTYTQGVHHVRLVIEKLSFPTTILIGIMKPMEMVLEAKRERTLNSDHRMICPRTPQDWLSQISE